MLDAANILIKGLSSSAADASKLLKAGITLMKNYSQLVALTGFMPAPTTGLQRKSELRVPYVMETDEKSPGMYLRQLEELCYGVKERK